MWFRLNEIFPPKILLIVCLLSCQDTAAHIKLKGLPSQRLRRQAGGPLSVDCELGQWSEWSECLPCQKKKYSYRALLHPAQYEGRNCTGSLWKEVPCHPTGTCVQTQIQDCGTDFQCITSGRCLQQHLVCNGEPDCRDHSDEANCKNAERFCDEDLQTVPGIREAAQGYNMLTKKRVQLVYDPAYYAGRCELVYNGAWRKLKYDATCERLYFGEDDKYFRKPYNVNFYQFLAHADSGFSSEYYAEASDLLNALKKDPSGDIGVTIGIEPSSLMPLSLPFDLGPNLSFDLGLSLSLGSGTLENATLYTAKNVGFIRTLTKVQTARFKMRRDDIFLHETMLQFLMDLPDKYNYGLYAKFINLYGTHFVTSGTMGGIFEYIIVVDKDEMRREEVTSSTVSACIGLSAGISLSFPMDILTARFKVPYEECSKVVLFEAHSQGAFKTKSVILDIIPRIRGGNKKLVSRLLRSWHTDAYRYWGRSLKLNPTVIDFELQPIYEILHRTNLAHIETKRQNLKRAFSEYLTEFNACRCSPCQNNGEPMLIKTACICECQQGSEGAACENTRQAGHPVHGMWTCWTPWTPCQSQSRRRTRQCTNPAPQNGGTACAGRNVQTEAC
ncbi:complement component C8 alpha chain [Heteronotia binoei]|uniref:complement component C8 alpha chain n=1 Tax=Heteronotia binoei TaxID=13085 RepID=UPI00292F0277|nr:complement component C8 alpha chain [Heteronotia binoei]